MSSLAVVPVPRSIIYLGMDVHKDSMTIAVLPQGAKAPTRLERLANDLPKLQTWLDRGAREGEVHAGDEASGAGYVLPRALRDWGDACEGIAPSLIPTRSGVHRTHDKRDAADRARLYRAGELVPVRIPSEADERVRDVVRCRETFQREILTSRHYILTFLATRGVVYREGASWCTPHLRWLQHLTTDGSPLAAEDRLVYRAYHALLMYTLQRRAALDRQIEQLAELPTLQAMVQTRPCVRGISLHSAMVLATELVDWRRCERPGQLACYLGLISREDSSGARQRRGSITTAGNSPCRHVRVHAAWSDRHRPQTSVDLKRRQQGQPPAVLAHAGKAQQRLHARFQHLSYRKRPQIAVVAVARELVGFLWAVAREVEPVTSIEGERGPPCGAEGRGASTRDGVMRAGQGATPASPTIEGASSRRIRFLPRCHCEVVIGVYQQDQPSMLPRAHGVPRLTSVCQDTEPLTPAQSYQRLSSPAGEPEKLRAQRASIYCPSGSAFVRLTRARKVVQRNTRASRERQQLAEIGFVVVDSLVE